MCASNLTLANAEKIELANLNLLKKAFDEIEKKHGIKRLNSSNLVNYLGVRIDQVKNIAFKFNTTNACIIA